MAAHGGTQAAAIRAESNHRGPRRRAEMPEQVAPAHLGEVGREIDLNLCPHIGMQFLKHSVVDFAAAGEKAAIHFAILHQRVDAPGPLLQAAFAFLQLNVVPFAGGHSPDALAGNANARKSSREVGCLLHQFARSAGVELLDQLEAGIAMKWVGIDPVRFQLFQICDYDQRVLHILLFGLQNPGLTLG